MSSLEHSRKTRGMALEKLDTPAVMFSREASNTASEMVLARACLLVELCSEVNGGTTCLTAKEYYILEKTRS